jgi:beta-xylosidase
LKTENHLALRIFHLALCIFSMAALSSCSPTPHYTNPVGGDIRMGDPFVLRHNDTYYLYGTSAGDGFTYWTSPDLVNWTPQGYAYRRASNSWGTSSFWAPEAAIYRDKCYLAFSCTGPDSDAGFRLALAVADSPAGPFEELYMPWIDLGWSTIDADLFIDDDGTPYVYFAKVGAHSNGIYGIIHGVQLSKDLSTPVGEPVLCSRAEQPWEEPDPTFRSTCNEGAFVFKHEGRYYMTYSAGHYASPRYGIGYVTAPAPLGPWTKGSDNPLVATDPAIGVSGPGHNNVTVSPDGTELFMVYHAHADPDKPGADRTVNIDRLVINDDGTLELIGPTRTPQPYPRNARAPR